MLQVKGPAFSMLQNFVLGRVYIFLSDLLYFVLKADVYVKSSNGAITQNKLKTVVVCV